MAPVLKKRKTISQFSESATLLLHREWNRELRVLPHQLDHSAAGWIFGYGDRELIRGFFGGLFLHIYSREIVLLILRHAPCPKILADSQLRGA